MLMSWLKIQLYDQLLDIDQWARDFVLKEINEYMQTIINILVFFVILGAIVLIHELGHFLTAKLIWCLLC